jgi:glycosyltransferase involved in cell wall biosynthesis
VRKALTDTGAPILSVIVANYNNEKYLRDCLDSILNQTYKDLEILVCDDCSTDHSLAILREYEKQYPSILKVISNASNLGVTQTRHLAILQARGEYLTTLDSDDYYYEDQKLQREMALVFCYKKYTGKDIVCFSNIVLVKGDKTLITIVGNSNNIKEGQIFKEILSRSCMIPRDFIVKSSVYFEVGGFDVNIPIYEDWDLKIRLANKCDFYFSKVNGTAYRRHGRGLSAAPASEHIEWMQRIFDKNLALICDADKERVRGQFKQFTSKRNENP